MVDVFISYPRVERAKVEPIKDKLEALGLKTFFDIHGIDGGDTFPDVIDHALKSAKAVLGVWSPRAFQSKWCMIECRVGAIRGVLVPIAVERFSELDMKSDFMTTNYFDLTDFDGRENHEGWQRTLRSLSRHVRLELGGARRGMTQEGLEALKAKAAATRRKTDALRSASNARLLKDRLDGLDKSFPAILRRSNRVVQGLYKALYQEHVRMGIDDQGRPFGSEESLAEHGSKMDAEIAYIRSKEEFGLKLQKKHYTHLDIPMPTTGNDRIAWKEATTQEIDELRAYLSEAQIQELLNGRSDAIKAAVEAAADPSTTAWPGSNRTQRQAPAPPAPLKSVPLLVPEMVRIPPGRFLMGSPTTEERWKEYDGREEPQHEVRIDYAFELGKYEVTVDEFAAFVADSKHDAGDSDYAWDGKEYRYAPRPAWHDPGQGWRAPGFTQTGKHPVCSVNWNDAQAYVAWLNAKLDLDRGSSAYRLPSEAEWEYACRAGTTTPFSFGATISTAQANYCRDETTPVGSFPANAFGLHDMHGNVREWCEDAWHASYRGAPHDGAAWLTVDAWSRILRGGSWDDDPHDLRSACRERNSPDDRDFRNGFRVARTV